MVKQIHISSDNDDTTPSDIKMITSVVGAIKEPKLLQIEYDSRNKY